MKYIEELTKLPKSLSAAVLMRTPAEVIERLPVYERIIAALVRHIAETDSESQLPEINSGLLEIASQRESIAASFDGAASSIASFEEHSGRGENN